MSDDGRSKLSGPLRNELGGDGGMSKQTATTEFELYVEAEPGRGSDVRKKLEGQNVTVRSKTGDYVAVDALGKQILDITAIGGVRHVQQRYDPEQHAVADKYITEGEGILNADVLQSKGITGSGARIAVIDHTFHTDNPKYKDDIVATIGPDANFTTGSEYSGGTQHGTACTEIVADVAPDAELVLASTQGSRTFDELMTDIESHDPDGATMSLGFWTGLRIDGKDPISQRVAQFTKNDRLFATSAGNNARYGHWDGPFKNDGSGLMKFEVDGSIQKATRFPIYMNPQNVPGQIHVHWDADWSKDNQEYEARLYDTPTSTTALDTSRTTNPVEVLELKPSQHGSSNFEHYYVEIENINATGNQHFDIFTWGSSYCYKFNTKPRSLGIPATSTDEDTLAVAAVQATDSYGTRNAADRVATYSSRGPTQHGRRGLDIAAPTMVSTTKVGDYGAYGALEDGGGFNGTSAASPHVGGVLGLLSQFGGPTSADVKEAIYSTARDISDTTVGPPVNTAIGYGHAEGQAGMEELVGLQQQWTASTGSRAQFASAATDGSRVYVGGLQEALYALDPADGSQAWSVARSGALSDSSPVVDGGTVFVGSGGGTMYALNAADGSTAWTKTLDSAITSSPAVLNSTVFYGTNDGRVQARAVSDGSKSWSVSLGDAVYSDLAAGGGLVYVTTNEGVLHCLDASTGATQWQFDTGIELGASSPTLGGGNLFLGADTVYSFSTTGSKRWEASYGGTAGSSPAYLNGSVFVGSADGSVYALDDGNGGTQLWTASTGGAIAADPAAVGDRVLVPSMDGTLYAYLASDGTQLGTATLPSATRASPTVANNELYLGTSDGTFVSH